MRPNLAPEPAAAHRQRVAADNVRMRTLICHTRRVCTALVGAAAVMVSMASPLGPATASPVLTNVHAFDGHRVTLDVYPAAGPLRGAAILSHGFTRSRRTLRSEERRVGELF